MKTKTLMKFVHVQAAAKLELLFNKLASVVGLLNI
jgi:hypothetical protein